MTSTSKNSLYIAVVTLVILSAFTFPSKLFAQDSVSLSVSPTIFEMTANPDQYWESTLRVINVNPYDLTVYAEVMNFEPLGEKGASKFIPIAPSPEVSTFAEWITVQDGAIVVPAEQTIQIPIKIKLPTDVPPGGHYAAILIGTKPPEKSDNSPSQVSTAQVVSSLLFLRVSGDITESGRIRSFRASESIINKPETTFELRFENLGNVHLQPQGEIRIKNMWGQERGVIPVNQQTLFGNVLRDSVRNFSFAWTSEWSMSDIGRYTAEATLAYGEDGRQFTSADTSFWLIPWKILLTIIAVVVALVVFVSWLIRLYVRRMLSLAGVDSVGPTTIKRNTSVASLVAPIEVGILDLRKQIDRRSSNAEILTIVFSFIRTNYLFFVGIIVGLLTLYVVGWYIINALSSDRSYEVVVDNDSGPVTITSEDAAYEEIKSGDSSQPTEKRSTPPIVIVNRSGKNGAAAALASNLEELGFTISKLDTEIGVIEERTVIVYDPAFNEDALQLSTILDNSPISAYEPSKGEPAFTIYIGEELADKLE